MPNVAAICVYPSLIPVVNQHLKARGVKKASVAGGFPASQTFITVKTLEAKMATEAGANEIDMVISVGKFLDGNYKEVFDEIAAMKHACGKAHLKVILETGALKTTENIRLASGIAMEAGADFIKTSTGKMEPAATPEAVITMAEAISDYYKKTNRKVGIKPAGGISEPEQAILYLTIVEQVIGNEWTNSELFRIGASRLANTLLQEISSLTTKKIVEMKYF